MRGYKVEVGRPARGTCDQASQWAAQELCLKLPEGLYQWPWGTTSHLLPQNCWRPGLRTCALIGAQGMLGWESPGGTPGGLCSTWVWCWDPDPQCLC